MIPMFVCPGVKDVPLDYVLFPFGGGISKLNACPGRDICQWYAAHDLGGEMMFSDTPPETQMTAQFLSHPFSCPNFQELYARAAAVRRQVAPAVPSDRVIEVSFRH